MTTIATSPVDWTKTSHVDCTNAVRGISTTLTLVLTMLLSTLWNVVQGWWPSWTIKCSFDMMTRWTNSLVGHFNCRNSCMPNTNSQVLVMNSWYKASEYLAIVNSETCSPVFLLMSIFSELMYIDIVKQNVMYHEKNCNLPTVMYQFTARCILCCKYANTNTDANTR